MTARAGEPDLDAQVAELLTLLPPLFAGLRNAAPSPELGALMRQGLLGPRHFPALMLVATNEPLGVGELAAKLHQNLATTSQLVSELDRAGLLERHQDPADRRRTIVTVKNHSRPLIAQWHEARAAPIRRALEQLTPTERRTLTKALQILDAELTSLVEHDQTRS